MERVCVREKGRIWLLNFKEMTGALAPFSYLVSIYLSKITLYCQYSNHFSQIFIFNGRGCFEKSKQLLEYRK
jgi:hypothetical protein